MGLGGQRMSVMMLTLQKLLKPKTFKNARKCFAVKNSGTNVEKPRRDEGPLWLESMLVGVPVHVN